MATRRSTRGKTAEKDKPKEEDRIKVERFSESLPCILTPEQLADRANRSAHLVEDRDHLDEELKAVNKTEKSKIAKVESEIRSLSNEVRTRTTYREVRCERRYNYTTGRICEVRIDTGEVISDREMNDAKKQRDLEFGGGGLDDEFSDTPANGDGEEGEFEP